MSNVIGDLLWNYFTKPIQQSLLDRAYTTEFERRSAGANETPDFEEMVFRNLSIQDPGLQAEFRIRCKSLPESKKYVAANANDLLDVAKGEAAKVQLERIAGIQITPEDVYTTRLFDQLGVMTNIAALASAAEIAGAAVPTTNLQYAGVAVNDYLNGSGLSQITGFGYGMLFSNVVSPLVTQEMNLKVRTTLPDPLAAIQMSRHGYITKAQKEDILGKYGYRTEYADALEKLSEYYPNAQDFITFAVRDTFKPEIVEKYGYDKEYPSDIDPFVIRSGMSVEWMHHFWRAHWQLPSPQMGYEMMHRDIIKKDELETLLRIGDMAPWWIDKVIGISYSPYTRVDTRRLFVDGVIDRAKVLRNYKDIGYDEEHAENLTEWTCKGLSDEKKAATKDLTEAKIMKAYEYGEYDTAQTTVFLKALGYNDEEAALIISIRDYEITFDELDQEWKVIKAKYLAGLLNDDTAVNEMERLQLPQKQQEKWLRQLQREALLVEIAAYAKSKK